MSTYRPYTGLMMLSEVDVAECQKAVTAVELVSYSSVMDEFPMDCCCTSQSEVALGA